MTDFAVLFALSLVTRWGCLLMTWREAREHSRMLRKMARIKHEHRQQLRRWSRTPGGSTNPPRCIGPPAGTWGRARG